MINNNLWIRSTDLKSLFVYTTLLTSLFCPPLALAQTLTNLNNLVTQQTQTDLNITSVTHNGVNHILSAGETLTISIKGTAGVEASVLLVGDKQTVQEITAKEVSPGVYMANIKVTESDRLIEGAILARLQKGNRVIYSAASQSISFGSQPQAGNTSVSFLQSLISTTTRERNTTEKVQQLTTLNSSLPLLFISHKNGDLVDKNGFIIKGQTQPNAEVKVKVTSSLSMLGNFVTIEGNALVDKIVIADNKGNFQIEIPPASVSPSGLKYTINAVASIEGKSSPTKQLTLIQK